MLIDGEVLVGDDFRIAEQRVVVVDRAAGTVRLFDHLEPMGAVLLGKDRSDSLEAGAHALARDPRFATIRDGRRRSSAAPTARR